MVQIKVHDLKSFEQFLSIASKFVQQAQLVVRKEQEFIIL
jgi:hypothetical protein